MVISNTKTKSMAMCGNQIQRVKIVINDKIIEQVTEFKYLGYCISEYRSDLEDKLQIYNKINGAIRRHFGKNITFIINRYYRIAATSYTSELCFVLCL
jgi:thiamine monophosphate synthase